MGTTDRLYIIIPAYNEEDNIEEVVSGWHYVVASINAESRLCVIDDGSKDNTLAKLQELQDRYPKLEAITKKNGGHGSTIYFGYKHALENGADYIFQTDSDGQTLPCEIDAFWNKRQNYDIQIGDRRGRQDGFSRIFVTKILKLVVFFQFGVWSKDVNTPFRLMSSKSLYEIIQYVPSNHNLTNVLLTVFYHKKNKKIKYRNITFRPRQGGVNSINFKRIVNIGWKAVQDFANITRNRRD